jgi:hypothetical protein
MQLGTLSKFPVTPVTHLVQDSSGVRAGLREFRSLTKPREPGFSKILQNEKGAARHAPFRHKITITQIIAGLALSLMCVSGTEHQVQLRP